MQLIRSPDRETQLAFPPRERVGAVAPPPLCACIGIS
jgi:hypothetical protein